ncbi:MAG: hypothetical protein ABI047_03275 [Jatrophihabitantaceae bacterium]
MTKRTKATKATRRTRGDARAEPMPAYIATPTAELCVIGEREHPFDRDGVPIPVAASTGKLCTGHRFDLDHFADGIRHAWFMLAFMVEPGSGQPGGGSRSKSADPPAPIDLVAAALRDHRNPTAGPGDIPSMPGVIASWVMVLADRKPLRTFAKPHIGWRIHPDGTAEKIFGGEPRGLLPTSAVAQLDLLVRHHDWIAEQDWASYYWAQLKQLCRAMEAKVDQPDTGDARSTRAIAQKLAEAQARR